MRGSTLTVKQEVDFFIESCANCGVLFGMTQDLHEQLLKKGTTGSFYCPNGHGQHYTKRSDELLRKDAEVAKENAEAALQAERDQRLAAERELKRHRARAKGGACPVCKRTFVQVTRHMKTQHPDFTP